MKKIKAFFYVFHKSISSFEYYKDILTTPFIFSIKYLAVLALFATVIVTGVISATTVPEIKTWIYEQKNELISMYPEDLVFTVKEGKWDINRNQPYIVKTPQTIELPDKTLPENLVVFDRNGTINDFEELNTMILVNENNLLIQTEEKLEVYPLKNIPDGELTKQEFVNLLSKTDEIIKYLPIGFVLLNMVIFYIYFFVIRAVYLLVVAFFLMIVNMVIKPNVEFPNLYRIALHSMTIPLLIDVVLTSANINIVEIPWFLLLNIILGTLVIAKSTRVNE